jgi:hypothetical protein
MRKLWVYILGLIPLVYFYDALKARVSGILLVIIALVYLVFVRILSEKYGK